MSGEGSRYSDRVRELFAELPGAGALPEGAGRVAGGEAVALDRGAWVRFDARVDSGRIADCRFRVFGCPHTLAAAALVAHALKGSPVASPPALDAAGLARELGAPAEKMGRLLVVEDALRALIGNLPRVQ